ncbi:tRNA (guanine(10)-N(2))-methyltransferase [Malassezia yamatoensis]|uniref:tRNA (guanine(10)-N(2))-methyltransferase n=1 Tax=Malassezia yamatoensis TaxID=253288 RepID=A0AAJ6CGE9_9BASI|nr:tRNA (guanine(10)-N(2))-methyltransferase [Malassezia yamatoensis]
MEKPKVYVLHFAHSHVEFRLPEFAASAKYLGIDYELLDTPSRLAYVKAEQRPFVLCRLPSDEAARELLARCSCLRAVWELWTCSDTYEKLHSWNREEQPYQQYSRPDVSWKAIIQGFNAAISDKRRLELIEDFTYMNLIGPTRMHGADLTWGVIEEYVRSHDAGTAPPPQGDQDPRLVQLFFGRKIKDRSGRTPARDLIDDLSLKKRQYIGNTSMESEMSVIMANMALAGPSKFIYDPFAGTGSMLYACSMLGAFSFGSDIDGRMLRGRKEKEGESGVARSAKQYGLTGRILDTATFDLTNAPWRSPFREGAGNGIFDAIVTDPPYGVRAGAKRLGKRDQHLQRDEPFIMHDGTAAHTLPDYLPPTKPYPLSHLTSDLLEYASALLIPSGRLVFWLPTMNEEGTETPIPEHAHFHLVAHSLQDFGKWGRRLITLEKKADAPSAPFPLQNASQGPARANEDPHEFRNRSLETVIGNVNATNRKLEEQISVGKEFGSIAELWGRFSSIMAQAGVPDPEKLHRSEDDEDQNNAK